MAKDIAPIEVEILDILSGRDPATVPATEVIDALAMKYPTAKAMLRHYRNAMADVLLENFRRIIDWKKSMKQQNPGDTIEG